MGTKQPGEWAVDTNPSWTDETLPLHVRQVLLERALDQIKANRVNRVQGANRPGNQGRPHHPGESGSEASGHGD